MVGDTNQQGCCKSPSRLRTNKNQTGIKTRSHRDQKNLRTLRFRLLVVGAGDRNVRPEWPYGYYVYCSSYCYSYCLSCYRSYHGLSGTATVEMLIHATIITVTVAMTMAMMMMMMMMMMMTMMMLVKMLMKMVVTMVLMTVMMMTITNIIISIIMTATIRIIMGCSYLFLLLLLSLWNTLLSLWNSHAVLLQPRPPWPWNTVSLPSSLTTKNTRSPKPPPRTQDPPNVNAPQCCDASWTAEILSLFDFDPKVVNLGDASRRYDILVFLDSYL